MIAAADYAWMDTLANRLDVILMFVILSAGFLWKKICFGYQLTERDARIAALEAERKELLRHIFRSVGVFSKALGREIIPREDLLPKEGPDV